MSDGIMFTDKDKEMLQATHDAVIRIEAKLNNGMTKKLDEMCESHYKLKRNFYLLMGFLGGSGILTGTILAAMNL
jgi:hypothetical protein